MSYFQNKQSILERMTKYNTILFGWGSGNENSLPRTNTGWGSEIEVDLTLGSSDFEILISKDDLPDKVYRAGSLSAAELIEREAERYVSRMKKENPHNTYSLEKLYKK